MAVPTREMTSRAARMMVASGAGGEGSVGQDWGTGVLHADRSEAGNEGVGRGVEGVEGVRGVEDVEGVRGVEGVRVTVTVLLVLLVASASKENNSL